MSYEIVKNCRVMQNKENGCYYAVLKTASNNCYPRYYGEWTVGLVDNNYTFKTKEECEKWLLLQFFHGNIQRGSSKYWRTARAVWSEPDLIKRYRQLDKRYDKVTSVMWRAEDRNSEKYQKASDLAKLIREKRDNEITEVLYNYMITHKEVVTNKVEPFCIIDKSSGNYVVKITKTKYYTNYGSENPVYFTSKELWDRVRRGWWTQRFEVKKKSEV